MKPLARDRELLSGLVAVSEQFVDHDELLKATKAWISSPAKESLVSALVRRGALSEVQLKAVESIVEEKSQAELSDSLSESMGVDVYNAMRSALQRIGTDPTVDLNTRAPETSLRISEQPLAVSEEDRFELRHELARGGLGEVFVAHDKQLNRAVALKQILNRWAEHPDSNSRFLLEAEITGRLEHPGVVPVYALGRRSDDRYYYTMRLIRGVNLGDKIAEYFRDSGEKDVGKQNLALRALLRRFIDVCNTIEYAHSKGVIHRDLKPANIMLGKYGETLVVDWGLAKQVDVAEQHLSDAESILALNSGSGSAAATQFGSVIGTPTHMSPEQASGRMHQVGPASDIYCLGATLYHLLTGKPPHQHNSMEGLLQNIIDGNYPRPREVEPTVPHPLEAICAKAMRLRDTQRYASARSMAADIERWLADQPVLAYREPMLAWAARSLRRHQTVAVSIAVASILLCLAAVIGSFFWQQATARQQEQARQIQSQQQQRQREDQEQLAQRLTTAQTNLAFGLQEAGPGRFASALSFFRQGEQACANEPRLEKERFLLEKRSWQMTRLVQSEQLWKEAMDAMVFEQDPRALALMAADMRQLRLFEQMDWWEHLPTESLGPDVADRIEKRVHLELALFTSLLGKHMISAELLSRRALGLPPKEDPRRDRLLTLMKQVSSMAQCYRRTRWVKRVEDLRRYLNAELAALPRVEWQPDNFVDSFMLGCMTLVASQSGKSGIGSAIFARFLNIEDPGKIAMLYLRRATELDPENDIAHLILGLAEHDAGNFDYAQSSYTTSHALRPDQSLAFVLRSQSYYEQALQEQHEDQRRQLLNLSIQDIQSRIQRDAQYESSYWLLGNSLQQLGQRSQAVTAYLAAFDREPPVEMVRLNQWQFLLQGRDPNRVRRLSYGFEDRFDEAMAFADELLHQSPTNPRFRLLRSTTELALGHRDAAAKSANQVLLLSAQQPGTPPTLSGQANAILGEVARKNENWPQARENFSAALQLDPQNVLALAGLASTLERLASDAETATTEAADTMLQELAVATYEQLAKCSFTDWQAVLAHQGLFRLQLARRDFQRAHAALETMLQIDRGQDLRKLSDQAKSHGADAIVQSLDAMGLEGLLVAPGADIRDVNTLALRNGGFELGLSAYWEPWTTLGECLAEVEHSAISRPGSEGSQSLLIRHRSQAAPGIYALLRQQIPTAAGNRYRLSLWAKGEELTAGGVQIFSNEQLDQPILDFPAGNFDWQKLEGEFEVEKAADNDGLLRLVPIRIVSQAPGNAWLDDIRIQRVDP